VKRTICKTCQTVLIPGVSATVRIKSSSSHWHATCYTCTSCHTSRTFPSPPTLQPSSALPPSLSSVTQPKKAADTAVMENDTDSRMAATMEEDLSAVTSSKRRQRPKKKQPTPRLPPLFQRDVGHVIFVGNNKTGHVMKTS